MLRRITVSFNDDELYEKMEKHIRKTEVTMSEFMFSTIREFFKYEENQWETLFKRLDNHSIKINNSNKAVHITLELLNFYIWHQMALTPDANYSPEEKKQLAVSANERQKRFLEVFKHRLEGSKNTTLLWDKLKEK